MMNVVGTLILTPTSNIVACDEGAMHIFHCTAEELFDLPIAALIPTLPLHAHVVSDNILYVNQFGDLMRWQRYSGRAPNGRTVPIEMLISRCGFRPAAALCLFVRAPWDELEHTVEHNALALPLPLWPGLATMPRPAAVAGRSRVAAVHP